MSLLSNLVNKGELPTVNVEISISKETIIDAAVAGIIAAFVVILINKFVISKI
jgi:hypothetical protein